MFLPNCQPSTSATMSPFANVHIFASAEPRQRIYLSKYFCNWLDNWHDCGRSDTCTCNILAINICFLIVYTSSQFSPGSKVCQTISIKVSLHMWGNVRDCFGHHNFYSNCPLPWIIQCHTVCSAWKRNSRVHFSEMWVAGCLPTHQYHASCCDLPCVSPQLRSITRTDCAPPQTPIPTYALWGISVSLFYFIIIHPLFERAVSAGLPEHSRYSIDRMSSVGCNRGDTSLV